MKTDQVVLSKKIKDMQTILITGGTGLIGKTLVPFLTSREYEVIILTREKEKHEPLPNVSYALWDIKKLPAWLV